MYHLTFEILGKKVINEQRMTELLSWRHLFLEKTFSVRSLGLILHHSVSMNFGF